MRPLIASLVLAALCSGADDVAIFSPPANSAWVKAPVQVVVRAAPDAKLLLDGKPVTTESPVPGVFKATISPAPGEHELTAGPEHAKFFVGPNAPAAYKPFREHPAMMGGCETCHAIKEGAWRFNKLSLTRVCSQCHNKEVFVTKHTHEMGILPDCQMCHAPHGSTAVSFLKLDKTKACKQCHN